MSVIMYNLIGLAITPAFILLNIFAAYIFVSWLVWIGYIEYPRRNKSFKETQANSITKINSTSLCPCKCSTKK